MISLLTKKNSVLNNKNFLLLLTGKIVSQLGNWIYYLAIVFFVSQSTNSTTSTGIVLFFNAVPVLIFGTIAGSVCKRYSKKKILVISDLISGFFSLYLGIRAYLGYWSLMEVCIITFFLGVTKSFFSPALFSSIPIVVDKSELNRANSLIKSVNGITNILGPILGGTIIAFIGCPLAFILNGISFIISAISEMFIKMTQDPNNYIKLKWHKTVKKDFVEAFKYILSKKIILGILIVFGIMTFFTAPIVLILQQLVDKYYSMNAFALSIIIMADAVGVLISGIYLIFKPKVKHQREFIYIFPIFCGIALITIGNIINFYLAVIVMFVQGFISGFGEISLMTIFQSEVPDNERGMVFSLYSMLLNSLTPISMILSGFLLEYISLNLILTICGSVLILGALVLCYEFILKEKKHISELNR